MRRDADRHPWRCRRDTSTGRSRPEPPGDPRGARAASTLQALALCDLVADPATGITRVTVVGAGPGLLAAIEDVAAGAGSAP
jgi:hypothetical protein